jgi:hypothetical protein
MCLSIVRSEIDGSYFKEAWEHECPIRTRYFPVKFKVEKDAMDILKKS